MQTIFYMIKSFLLKYVKASQKKTGHSLQYYGFRRELYALRFRCKIYVPLRYSELRSSSRARSALMQTSLQRASLCLRGTHIMQPICESPILSRLFCLVHHVPWCLYRSVMSGSESVPLRKVLKRCMLFRQCCEAHIHRNPAKQSSLAKVASISVAYTLLSGGASGFPFRMRCKIL